MPRLQLKGVDSVSHMMTLADNQSGSHDVVRIFEKQGPEYSGRLTILVDPTTQQMWFVGSDAGKAAGHDDDNNSRRAIRNQVEDDSKTTWEQLRGHFEDRSLQLKSPEAPLGFAVREP